MITTVLRSETWLSVYGKFISSGNKWEEYADALDAVPSTVPLETQRLSQRGEPGRPRFEISKSQLEYLASLSFKWPEVAALLVDDSLQVCSSYTTTLAGSNYGIMMDMED